MTQLADGLYLTVTPAGALHAVATRADGPEERLLRRLLAAGGPVRTDDLDLQGWTGCGDVVVALDVVRRAEATGWLEGHTRAPLRAEGPLGAALPDLLAPLSSIGRAVLVDDQGFALATAGFSPEAEQSLAALAAEIARMAARRHVDTFSAEPLGWGLVDATGEARVGFYPVVVGDLAFVLVVGGTPCLDHPALVALVAALSARYAPTPVGAVPDPQPQPLDDRVPVAASAGGTDHA